MLKGCPKDHPSITPEPKRIARFIGGLAPEIKASVKASSPTTFRSAADLSLSLTLDVVRNKAAKASDDGKRKKEDENSYHSNKKKKGNSDHQKSSGSKKGNQQSGEKTRFEPKSQSQPRACGIYKSREHKTLDCKDMANAVCFGCGEKGHIKTTCPTSVKGSAAKEGKPKNESA
ncbi:uncharacterized protein LOC118484019 [Helianthus annuus]|uniref:uncharacterized protein LOC118484019 n=1 Tax=Helianthus annuus TaxID=4232 RepID=UPI001652D1B1|nr:uncharacterized protein LOC118484019 [Helianthus annuus]